MLILTEFINIVSVIVLIYSIYTIKKRHIESKHSKILVSTMIAYLFFIIIDRLNFYLIGSLSLDIAIAFLKFPLTVILVFYLIRLMKNKNNL